MISLICWFLASVCNGTGDTSLHHYGESIFPKGLWWNGEISWRNKYIDGDKEKGRNNKLIQFSDAFHFFKMIMLIFMILSILFYDPKFYIIIEELLGNFWSNIIIFFIYGGAWIFGFWLMYDFILLKKTWNK